MITPEEQATAREKLRVWALRELNRLDPQKAGQR